MAAAASRQRRQVPALRTRIEIGDHRWTHRLVLSALPEMKHIMPLEGERTKHSLHALTPTDNLTLKSSRPNRLYWVVSPNVKNSNATVGEWAKLSLRARAAFMGWPLNPPMGRRFAGVRKQGIIPGDVILIARRHRGEPQIVGLGVVHGKYLQKIEGINAPDNF